MTNKTTVTFCHVSSSQQGWALNI